MIIINSNHLGLLPVIARFPCRCVPVVFQCPRPGCVEPVDAENVAALVRELHMPRLTWAEARDALGRLATGVC